MIFDDISKIMKKLCKEKLQKEVCKMFSICPSTMSGIVTGKRFVIDYKMVTKLFELGYDIKLVKRNVRRNPVTLDEKVAAARAEGKSYGEWQAAQYATQTERKRNIKNKQ